MQVIKKSCSPLVVRCLLALTCCSLFSACNSSYTSKKAGYYKIDFPERKYITHTGERTAEICRPECHRRSFNLCRVSCHRPSHRCHLVRRQPGYHFKCYSPWSLRPYRQRSYGSDDPATATIQRKDPRIHGRPPAFGGTYSPALGDGL